LPNVEIVPNHELSNRTRGVSGDNEIFFLLGTKMSKVVRTLISTSIGMDKGASRSVEDVASVIDDISLGVVGACSFVEQDDCCLGIRFDLDI